jgi:hypothetical protein
VIASREQDGVNKLYKLKTTKQCNINILATLSQTQKVIVAQEVWTFELLKSSTSIKRKGEWNATNLDNYKCNYNGCFIGKQVKHEIPKQNNMHVIEKNAFIHLKLCGPMLHSSLGGSQYYISFTG